MNCTVIQRRLLSAEQPEQPPPDIKGHLAQCPSCRAWHRRLVQMERLVPHLPVPPSTAKERFLERMKEEGGRTNRNILIHPPSCILPPLKKERGLRKLSLAFAMAASLLVFALGWWAWPRNPIPVPELRLNEQVKLEQRLNKSFRMETPKQRVLSLAKLAEEIHGEARTLVDNSEKLEEWAGFYSRIVGKHLMEQARQLPQADRSVVLEEVAVRLARMESDASRFAAQMKTAAPRSAASFRRIALSSQKGERDLRALMKG